MSKTNGAIVTLSSLGKEPTYEGFLLHREPGLFGDSFKKRWCVLQDKTLFFFESRVPQTTAKIVLLLDGYFVDIVDDRKLTLKLIDRECLAVFKLMHAKYAEEWLCAPSEEDLQDWIQLILLEISRESVRMSTVVDFAPLDDADVMFMSAPPPRSPMLSPVTPPSEVSPSRPARPTPRSPSSDAPLSAASSSSSLASSTSSNSVVVAVAAAPPPAKPARYRKLDSALSDLDVSSASLPDAQAAAEAEAQRVEEARRAAEAKASAEAQQAAEAKASAEAQQAAEAKASAEAKQAAEAKAAAEAKQAADAKRAAEAKAAADAKRAADEAKKAAEAKKAEEAARPKLPPPTSRSTSTMAPPNLPQRTGLPAATSPKSPAITTPPPKSPAQPSAALPQPALPQRPQPSATAPSLPQRTSSATTLVPTPQRPTPAEDAPAPAMPPRPATAAAAAAAAAVTSTPSMPPQPSASVSAKTTTTTATTTPSMPPRPSTTASPSTPTMPARPTFSPTVPKPAPVSAPASAPATPTMPQRPTTTTTSTASQVASRDATTGRVVVVNVKPPSSMVSSASMPAFSTGVGSVQSAVIDWINSQLGSEKVLKDLGHVPISSNNIGAECRDGTLLCFLVNTIVANTLDVRTINTTGLSDPKRMTENVTLCINTARALGCAISTSPADIVSGKGGAAEAVAWQLVRTTLRNRLKVFYNNGDLDVEPPNCALCNRQSYDQFSQLKSAIGPQFPSYCTACTNDSVKLLSIFANASNVVVSAAPSSASRPSPTKPGQRASSTEELASAAAPAPVLALAKTLRGIENRYDTLSDQELSSEAGKLLMSDMKQFMSELQPVSQKHAMHCLDLVTKYNELARLIPAKINQANQKIRAAQQKSQPSASPSAAGNNRNTLVAASGMTCPKCSKPLQGDVVEVSGSVYHAACFGCATCGRALSAACISIDGKPYCDRCGKKAFIQSRLAHRAGGQ